MAKRTRKAAVETNRIDNRTITVGPLFRQAFGTDWFVQADCGPWTSEHVTYTADGPFDTLAEAMVSVRVQAEELGWEPGSFDVTVDE